MALVLTLILLSVALIMAVAFLAISGHERGSVTTQTDTTVTRLAADSGLANAEAQIAANILSATNPYGYGLVVSTNYDANDAFANLANLRILPRAPVWLTNLAFNKMEDRFYIDLNRNGQDDPNGWTPDTDISGLTNLNVSIALHKSRFVEFTAKPEKAAAATDAAQ